MFIRRLVIIILAILVVAGGFQFLRSFGMFNLVKNINADVVLAEAQSIEIPQGADLEKYLIIANLGETNSASITLQLEETLGYMKKDYMTINYDSIITDLEKYECIFLTFERMDNIKNISGFIDYVYNGGSLAMLTRPVTDKTFEENSKYLGIKSYQKQLSRHAGIKVISDCIIGAKGFETDQDIILNSSLDLELDADSRVFLTSYDDNPLLWTRQYGSGRFVVFNGTMLNEKINRGVMASAIGLAKSDLIYPVMNIKMVHIDDFPAPIPQGTDKKIYDEFFLDIQQFYREVWWPDMIRLSKKYDIKYSAFIIENYNDVIKPPLTKGSSTNMKNLLIYGKEILGLGGELGIHGYNHQSLAPQGYIKQDLGYNSWASTDDMKQSIIELLRFVHSVFGHYVLKAYVPPSNILSPEGREAVKLADPDLKVIASVFLPNLEGDVYEQEYEVADDGIIEFPRITAGYENTEGKMWRIYNGVNMFGVFSHFIHPDDVLDPVRSNNKSWTRLSEEFDLMLGEVNSKYGWLRSFTISPASEELVKYLEARPYIVYRTNNISIYTDNFRNDVYAIIRTDKKITGSVDCDYEKIGENAYLLTLKSKGCSIEVQ